MGATYTKKRAIMYGVAALAVLILYIIGVALTHSLLPVTAIEIGEAFPCSHF